MSLIPQDKLLHFTMSMIIALFTGCIAKFFGADKFVVLGAAWFVGLAFGFAKELYDEKFQNGADSKDWVVDVIGTSVGTLIAFLLVC